MDEKDFDYTYVPEHLKEKVKNCMNLSFGERFDLIAELERGRMGEDRRRSRPE